MIATGAQHGTKHIAPSRVTIMYWTIGLTGTMDHNPSPLHYKVWPRHHYTFIAVYINHHCVTASVGVIGIVMYHRPPSVRPYICQSVCRSIGHPTNQSIVCILQSFQRERDVIGRRLPVSTRCQ